MSEPAITRRELCLALAAAGSALGAESEPSRLTAKPVAASNRAASGLHPLKLRATRDALLYIPESATQFERVPLPARVAMAGFSDGASYSLSIGLANGDLFCAVFGFSPGFIVPGRFQGHPPVFISHGTEDQILPIEACSRQIVPALKQTGYDVTYREFDGPHTLPPDIAADAMHWFLTRRL